MSPWLDTILSLLPATRGGLSALERKVIAMSEEFDKFVESQSAKLAAIGASQTKIKTDISTLQSQVQALQEAQGTLTPAQQSALNTLAATAAGLADQAAQIDALVDDPASPPGGAVGDSPQGTDVGGTDDSVADPEPPQTASRRRRS